MSEELSPFHAALIAFEIRFEIELTSRWEKLESDAADATHVARSGKKLSVLNAFFTDAEKEIASVVHEYFPRLLQVAMAQRQHLGNESPLAWTQAQVLRQVRSFLGVDEKFDHTADPRDDSRLAVAMARIALGVGWLDEVIPADFVLPGWADSQWALLKVLGRPPRTDDDDDDAESLPPLTRAKTVEWVKHREFSISKMLERQIENDEWDGVIEAGKADVSVLDAYAAVDRHLDDNEPTQGATEPLEDSFVKEATTWAISFDGETCRLKMMIGLDYIAVLLENPGNAMRALDLRTRAVGLPADSTARLLALSSADGGFGKNADDQQEDRSPDQSDFALQEVIDEPARRNVKQELEKLERDLAYYEEIGDARRVDELRREHTFLQSYLKGAQDLHGRPRVFSSENEKARTSLTKALRRAYEAIGKHAPKTAAYLKSQISTGSTFMYRDGSISWKVRRTP